MKPLTIDELKALQVGDWVWVINLCKNRGTYRRLTAGMLGGLYFDKFFDFEQYGRLWLAYKNKEQAEGGDEKIRKEAVKEFAQIVVSVIWEEKKGEKITIHDLHGVIKDIANQQYGLEME